MLRCNEKAYNMEFCLNVGY